MTPSADITVSHALPDVLLPYIRSSAALEKVYFASAQPAPPALAYQVDFPRLELVVDGELQMTIGSDSGQLQATTLTSGQALFLNDYCWNKPDWDAPCTTLSLLFGKQSLGFSLLRWDGSQFEILSKDNVARRGPRTGAFVLRALNELNWHPEDQDTARLLIRALISYSLDLLKHPPETPSRSQALFETVRNYIDNHYQEALNRETVAAEFYISPNYLSQLFHREGGIKFNEYLVQTRLEKAKFLLKQYDMKVKEVAHSCGFSDSNYFCRIFRKSTGRSPSEYRVQYRAHIAD